MKKSILVVVMGVGLCLTNLPIALADCPSAESNLSPNSISKSTFGQAYIEKNIGKVTTTANFAIFL